MRLTNDLGRPCPWDRSGGLKPRNRGGSDGQQIQSRASRTAKGHGGHGRFYIQGVEPTRPSDRTGDSETVYLIGRGRLSFTPRIQ